MAERILYIPVRPNQAEAGETALVRQRALAFAWQGWRTPEEKRANVALLHATAADIGIAPVLEISTKSPEALGRKLSPFHLRCRHSMQGREAETSFESLWNGSKIFETGGPFPELLSLPPWESLKDPRNSVRKNGRLLKVRVGEKEYPIRAGYDFLYLQSAVPAMTAEEWDFLVKVAGFTEVTLNPASADTCQAGTVALMSALWQRGLLKKALVDFDTFREIVNHYDPGRYAQDSLKPKGQMTLF